MTQVAFATATLRFLEDRWDPAVAATLDEPELLRYRSNLLGSDLRITNFAGGNTSSKITEIDPLTGETCRSALGQRLRRRPGQHQARPGLPRSTRKSFSRSSEAIQGVDTEDDMVAMYPLCTFRNNPVAASIDTPLHGFLPFPHVDHLHPDWGIALAASANGKAKMDEFNREFQPLAGMASMAASRFRTWPDADARRCATIPGCDGIVLGGHGLFTWGETQRECYLNTITLIDQIGQFIARHGDGKGRGPVRRRSRSLAR